MMRVQDIQFLLDKMDDYQLKRSNNTACLCYAMGQALKCPADELEALWFAGLLLETGKLWILGKVDNEINVSFEDDFDIINRKEKMANYTLYTQALLKSLESIEKNIDFSPAITIIDQGEENIDGSGYPRHLQIENIDTLSQILRISSYYDYCRLKGASHKSACATLHNYINQFFTAKIVDIFIKTVEKNELQNDYVPERNFTIGELTDDEKF